MKIISHSVQLLYEEGGLLPTQKVEAAAKTCYQSELTDTEEKRHNFIRRLIKNGHTAMLEFVDITFRIITDRGVSHELVRHRMASYAQESTRYCNYGGKDMEFIKPVTLNEGTRGFVNWYDMMCYAEEYYNYLINDGYSPQIARSVLPNSLKTEICMKMNMRSFRNFIQLRTAKTAHPDMQHVANLCVDAIRDTEYFVFIEDLVE